MPTVFNWRQAIDGGGFQNAIDVGDNTVHSTYPNSVVSGGDVAGLHVTRNRNANMIWKGANRGEISWQHSNLSCIKFSITTDGRVYALSGRGSVGKNFMISTDGGQSWVASSFQIAADSRTMGNAKSRPSGRMICADSSGNYLWVAGKHIFSGSNQWGLARSSDQGVNFTPGFAMGSGGIPNGTEIRFVLQHPADPTVIFCGADGGNNPSDGGLYKITNAKAAPSVTKVAGPGGTSTLTSPNWFRDAFCVMEGTTPVMYFVAGVIASGSPSAVAVYRYDLTSGGGITNISSGDLSTTSEWTAIDGYRKSGQTVIWAGCWEATLYGSAPRRSEAVVVSRNGGSTWNKLTSSVSSTTMPSGREWWLVKDMPEFKLNYGGYDCSAIRIDPNDTDTVFCGGRAGVWRTTDDGLTWKPVMQGLGVSMSEGSVYNPASKSNIASGNIDWNVILSPDKFTYATEPDMKEPTGAGDCSNLGMSWSLQGLAIGVGGRSDKHSKGKVFTSDSPFSASGSFIDQGWQGHISNADNRLRAVAVSYGVSASGNKVILAVGQLGPAAGLSDGVVGDTGIWRKEITSGVSGGTWSKVEGSAFNVKCVQNTQRSKFYWPNPETNAVVYTYDRRAGKVWRSANRGVDWTNIWTAPAGEVNGTMWSGHMAGASVSILYVSTNTHVHRLTNANGSVGSIIDTTLNKPTKFTSPGPTAVDDDGWLYITQRNLSAVGLPTQLWRYANAASGNVAGDWEELTTAEFQASVAFPQNLEVITEGSNKTILADCWGNGLYIGEASGTPPPEVLPIFNENFENGGSPPVVGTAISTVNSNFGAVSGAPTFSATSREGDRSGSFNVGGTAGACYGDSEALDATPTYAVDIYFRLSSMPTINTRIIGLLDGAGVAFTGLRLGSDGKLGIQDGNTVVYTSTTVIEINKWYRLAAKWDANANTAVMKIWSGVNLLLATPTEDSGNQNYTNNTNVEKLRVGLLSTATTNTTLFIDEILTKNNGTWPDRGVANPPHIFILGFMPMGIKPPAGGGLPPGGYITIMFGRSIYQALVGGAVVPGGTEKTIFDAAVELQSRGMFGVGGVVMDRTENTTRKIISNFVSTCSWADIANLRDNYGWQFISHSKDYTKFPTISTDAERYQQSGATLITLENHGHMNGWGLYNYPGGDQTAAGPPVVNQYFAMGRQYGGLSNTNTQASVSAGVRKLFVHSVEGGRCNIVGHPCNTMPMDNDKYHDNPAELGEYLSPPPGHWHILQFYRFVTGNRGTVNGPESEIAKWYTDTSDWRARWTGQPELYPWNSFIEALNSRTRAATVVHPAQMATMWGLTPPRLHGLPAIT